MSETPARKRPFLSRRVRVILALVIIAVAVVVSFYLPHERDSANVTGDTLPITATITNPVGSISLNRGVDFNQVHFTVTKVIQAGAFSDDRKGAGAYTIRVQLVAQSEQQLQGPVGIDFPSLARLQLADGQLVSPKLVNLSPVFLPKQTVNGYIDFPVASQMNLSSLTLRLGSTTTLSFS
jgi:hypothetical protein